MDNSALNSDNDLVCFKSNGSISNIFGPKQPKLYSSDRKISTILQFLSIFTSFKENTSLTKLGAAPFFILNISIARKQKFRFCIETDELFKHMKNRCDI